jgi:hypothetical protein
MASQKGNCHSARGKGTATVPQIDDITRVKRAAEAELLARPGVSGVDVGYKYVGGERTDEIVVRVYVEQKRDVPAEERIPESIDGVRTDVREGVVKELADTKMYRPLLGGISVGPVRLAGSSNGTLGAIVTDNATQGRMALSCHHVFFDDPGSYDVSVAQPSAADLGPGYIIGSVARSKYDDLVDAAVVRLNEIVIPVQCQIADLGPVTGTGAPVCGATVRKRGRSSEWTYGTITGIDGAFNYPGGKRKGGFTVAPDPDQGTDVFAAPGDSGSVIVTSGGQVLGLLYAELGEDGIATPISTVMDQMGVSMATAGIGGHSFMGLNRGTAFDLDSSGKADHLVFFHLPPNMGGGWVVSVIARNETDFPCVYRRAGKDRQIGGYDLTSPLDDVFAFDYTGSGKLDHLALYRPGTGHFWIITKKTGEGQVDFTRVFPAGEGANPPANGIGGYDLGRKADRAFAFDYESTGKLDHIVLYRPDEHICWVVGRKDGTFIRRFPHDENAPHNGIGGYDLGSSADKAFAFDFDSSGKQDHIVLYRPGTGIIWIIGRKKNTDGSWADPPVFERKYPLEPENPNPPASGIGGYSLDNEHDLAFAYDYLGSGKKDHIVLYRPGTGIIWVVGRTRDTARNPTSPASFVRYYPDYKEGDNPTTRGIGGYSLDHPTDRAMPFDYDHSGKQNHLVLYRAGPANICWIVKPKPGIKSEFESVYRAWQHLI